MYSNVNKRSQRNSYPKPTFSTPSGPSNPLASSDDYSTGALGTQLPLTPSGFLVPFPPFPASGYLGEHSTRAEEQATIMKDYCNVPSCVYLPLVHTGVSPAPIIPIPESIMVPTETFSSV